MSTTRSRSALLFTLAAASLALAASVVSAQQREAPMAVTVKGRVLDDENKPIPGDRVKITVRVARAAQPYVGWTRPDGTYEIRDMPLTKAQRIDSVVFEHAAMHPQFVRLLSGVDATEVINKLMTAPPGPESYEDIFDQLLAYEGIYFTSVATQKATAADLAYYRESLRRMAGPGSEIYSGMGPNVRISDLVKKRTEVFRLYGLDPAGTEQIAGLGLCREMCTLKLKGQCQSTVIAMTNGVPRLFFLTGQGKGSASHEIACHTSLPVLVEGKVIRPSLVGDNGKVIAGDFQPTSFVADRRPQDGHSKDVLIAGVGRCGKCDLNNGSECQNVIVAKLDSKPTYYYLQPNETSGAIHMSGQTYVIRGEYVVPPRPAVGGTMVSAVIASQITALVSGAR